MGWFDEQIKLRKLSDQELFEDSFIHLSGAILGTRIADALNDKRQQTTTAIEDILRYYRIKRTELPDNITDKNEQLEYLLRPNGIMRREVILPKGWYKDAYGPMLAMRKDDGTVTALIPSKYVGYRFFDNTTGKMRRVNRKTQELFELEAVCFYKPFPLKALRIWDLYAYIFSTITRSDWIFILLTMAIVTAIGFLTTHLMAILYSRVLESRSVQLLVSIASFMICVSISQPMIRTIQTMYSSRVQTKMALYVEAASMMRILSLPPAFFKQFSAGELSSRVGYIKSLCTSLSSLILSTGISSLFSLAYISQIHQYAPSLVAPSLLVLLANMVVSILTVIIQTRISKLQMESMAKESGISYAMISGVQKIKLAGAEKRAFSRWAQQYAQTAKLTYNPPQFLKLSSVITTALTLAGTWVIYFFALESDISLGEYNAFMSAYGNVSGALLALPGIAMTVASLKPIIDMAKPLLDTVPEISEGKKVLEKLEGRIEISRVSFRYQESMPLVLNNISVRIKPGEYIALVGETGCGKSTLVRMLLGFETPQKGAVYFDGHDISTLDLRSLRRRIGVVMQNGQLFNGSIYDNIVIAAPWLTMSEAWEAAAIAGIDEDIRQMPMGMHTVVSEGTGGISGGQKQRLMIARAVAPKPKILIFDEATSALDNVTQKKVSDALDNLKCTRIVVAHRLSTIRQCDRILYLKDGMIREDGTYDELIKKNGLFAELVERQRLDT